MTVIVLSGPIGAGKSSLTSLLAEHLGTQAFYEGVDNNPILPLYYKDMAHYTFLLNTYLLNHRLAQINQAIRSEEHTSELQSRFDLVCRLLLEKKKSLPLTNTLHTSE